MSSLQKRLGQAGGHEQVTATAALAKMNERARPIRLNEITLDLGLQFRLDVKGKDGIDEKHVVDLMHVIADGADTDPVILYRVDKALLMVDGFHRYEAYRRSERKTIPAIVRDGTYPEAEEAAENANLQFKKALGDESKKYIFARRVQRGYLTNGISWQQLSDKAIAAELGVSYQTINNWFTELISGVNFLTPAGQGISIQVPLDRSVVYGRDGKEYQVQAIREANQQRAEEERKRRAVEQMEAQARAEAEKLTHWRASNVIFRAKYVADALLRSPSNRNIAQHLQIDLPSENTPDDQKTFGYYLKAAARQFRLTPGREESFIQDFQSTKDVRWYQDMLSKITPAIWESADSQNWTEDTMQQWLDGFHQRQSGPLPSAAPQPGMAQPKHPDAAYPQPKTLNRHQMSTPTAAATEPAVEEHTEQPAPCPFRVGQNVQVIETSEGGIVQATEYVDQAWQIRVELYDGLKTFTVHEIERLFREQGDGAASERPDELDDEAINTNPPPCQFQQNDTVIFKPTGAQAQVERVKWDGHTWHLYVVNTQGHAFHARAEQFDLLATVVEDHAVIPFRTGDIVRAIDGGQIFEVIGFGSDGRIQVEADDLDGEAYQYEGWAEEFEKYTLDAKPTPQVHPLPGGYQPSNGTQTQMAENYMALMKLIQAATADLLAIQKFDCNLQYLQTPETLAGIWDTLAGMRDQAIDTFTVVANRLNMMAEQGLPYDPTLAQATLKKGMRRT